LESSSLYISRTVFSIIDCTALAGSPPPTSAISSAAMGNDVVR